MDVELTADSSIFKWHVMCHNVHSIGEMLSPQLLIVGCHILVINTQQFPHFQALNMSVCLEVTVLVGLVVLACYLGGHFAHLKNLDTCELYLP